MSRENDSRQIARLRERYKREHTDRNATAWRLGQYAREHGLAVVDFGAHSARWVRTFTRGRDWVQRNP